MFYVKSSFFVSPFMFIFTVHVVIIFNILRFIALPPGSVLYLLYDFIMFPPLFKFTMGSIPSRSIRRVSLASSVFQTLYPGSKCHSQISSANTEFPFHLNFTCLSHTLFTYVCLPRSVSSRVCFTSLSLMPVSDVSATSRLRHWIS